MEKSANKRWKESGTTLSFKEWIERENSKSQSEQNFAAFDGIFTPTVNIQDSVQQTLDESKQEMKQTAGFKTPNEADKNTILGLDKNILVFSTLLVVGSLGYYFYTKLKKKS